MGKLAIETRGLVKIFGETRAVDGVDLAVPPAPSTACSARTAPARPPRSACSPRCCAPTAARPGSSATTSSREADAVRGRVSLTGQFASVDEDLTGHGEPGAARPPARLSRRRRRRARGRAARRVRPGRGGRPAGEEVLGRHAPAHRHRRQHRRHARAAVPRRADHRPRPAQPQPGVGHRPGAGRRRARRCC